MQAPAQQNLGTVLFVDDEEFILNLMQDFLTDAPFEVLTSRNPTTALKLINDVSIDMVISDYNMPQMDGLEFLRQVRKKNPEIRRVISTGFMDTVKALRTIDDGTISNLYQKPWNLDVLEKEIRNSLTLVRMLRNRSFLEMVNSIEQLPTLPTMYQKYQQALEAEASMEHISKIISIDPSITTQVIRLANSAFLGHGTIHSLDQAIVKIGLNNLSNILLTVLLTNDLHWSPEQTRELQEVFIHLSLINFGFSYLYRAIHEKSPPDDMSSLGLLYRVGIIVLLNAFPERYTQIRKYQNQHPMETFSECEVALGYAGTSSVELSAYLLGWWNFPETIVEMALLHQTPNLLRKVYKPFAELLRYTEQMVTVVTSNATDIPSAEWLTFVEGFSNEIKKDMYITLEDRYEHLQETYTLS
ncbi:MAG: HDOD domain-containing protein [Candidatus Marinimicrobia bacterium]|nr:HDOD domain-containing protein [Candidatus Neomarinimicrobiota bacterium]